MIFELLKDRKGKKTGERLVISSKDGAQLVAAGSVRAITDDPLAPSIINRLENAVNGFTPSLDGVLAATLRKYADVQSQA